MRASSFDSPTSCTVALTVSVSGAAEVEHRLVLGSGAAVQLTGIDGAETARAERAIGPTRALVVRPRQPAYTHPLPP